MVVGVRKYDIKYSMSALFWSQLPQTDTPHCVCMGWMWVEVCLGGKKEENETEDETEKQIKTKILKHFLLLFAILSNPHQNN